MTEMNTRTIGGNTMDDLTRYDIEDQENWYNTLLTDAKIDHKLSIGTIIYRDDYETFVDEVGVEKPTYFTSFAEAFEYCKTQHPEAEWDNLG
jgi:hypothetical protein